MDPQFAGVSLAGRGFGRRLRDLFLRRDRARSPLHTASCQVRYMRQILVYCANPGTVPN